jgi:hypothetical protein
MGFAKYARVVQVVGIVFTAYDLGVAADASFQTKRVQPIAKEAIGQTGGWAEELQASESAPQQGRWSASKRDPVSWLPG